MRLIRSARRRRFRNRRQVIFPAISIKKAQDGIVRRGGWFYGKRMEKSACPFCSLNCALEVLVEDDHILDVRPNPDSNKEPGGYCCRKGRSVMYYQENPERLEHPLKRVGDHFEQISWEQAFKEIGEKARAIYDKHGPKAFSMNGFGLAATALTLVPEKAFNTALGIKYMYNPIGFEFMGLP